MARTYQSVNYGTVSFLKKHFTEEGWNFLKAQLEAPKKRFNDQTSTVDFEAITIIFKSTIFDYKQPSTMTLGYRYREGKNPGWHKRR